MCHVTLLLCFMYWCLFLAKINLGLKLANFHQRNVVSVVVVVNSNLFYHHPLFLALSLFKFYTYLYLLHSNQEWYCVKWSKGKTIIWNVTILNRSTILCLFIKGSFGFIRNCSTYIIFTQYSCFITQIDKMYFWWVYY